MNLLTAALNYLWLHAYKYRSVERQHRLLVEQLRQAHRPLNVVFMALDLSLWHYQSLYELMVADPRFNPIIVLSPCVSRVSRENPDQDAESLRSYFRQKNIPFVDYEHGKPAFDIRRQLKPDLMFYTQPYEYLLQDEHDCRHFYDRLICYMPYGFWSSTGKLSYNLHFHNMAWRLYYSTSLHLQEARRVATNHGRNVRVTGYANADEYLRPDHVSPWKVIADGRQRKRLIWAPHFSIIPANSALPPRGSFIWMAELMLKLAREYSDRLQIAFKPHPALLTQLYQHPDWGKERADDYYGQWRSMENTQIETGQFIDLFMTSDAMVHDSGSFAVEYHYSQKPVMFVSRDMKPVLSTLSDFGKKAYDLHYIGHNEAEIRHFIERQVLDGDDPIRPQREQFYRDYLLPPNGKSVAQNMMDDLVGSLCPSDILPKPLKKGVLVLLFLLSLLSPPSAEAAPLPSEEPEVAVSSEKTGEEAFSFRQLILPSALITVGSFGVSNGWLCSIKEDVRNDFQNWRDDSRFKGDDYLRFLPAVANVGLGLAGVKSRHSLQDRLAATATASIVTWLTVGVTKHAVKEKRPDSNERISFPSGHTAIAFMGAEMVREEYGNVCGAGAYAFATGIAFLRLYNDRHWLNDVIAGAGFGILSARIGYWLLPWERRLLGWDNSSAALSVLPTYQQETRSMGLALTAHF